MVSAAVFATSTPARVEPVKDIISISGCALIAWPTDGPLPCTRLNTPAGSPASSMNSAMSCAESGACSLGLSTIVQPAAMAGATLARIWLIGQFQGVTRPHTPIGSRTTFEPSMRTSQSSCCAALMVASMWPGPAAA